MADAIEGVDLDQLHTEILQKLRVQFPTFKLIEFYRDEEERRAPGIQELPALFLDLTGFDIEDDTDKGTGQLALLARFEARVIDSFSQKKAKINVRKLATGLAYYIFKNKFFTGIKNKGVGASIVDAIVEDAFFPELDRFEVWRVDFTTSIVIGDNIWADEGVTPTLVYNVSPDIGLGHEDKYQEVEP